MNRQIKDLRDRVAETEVAAGVALTRLEELSAARKSGATETMLGLIGGSGYVLIRELMQNTFRTSDELELKTNHTVMGTLPIIPAKDRRLVLDYVLNKPASHAAEAVRNLRTSIPLSNVDNPPKIVMSTSSVPSEGKTTLTGLVLSQVDPKGMKRYEYGDYGGYGQSYKGYYEN